MAISFEEQTVKIGDTNIKMFKGGSGDPLLLLHGASGNRGPLHYANSLAENYTVYLPTHPGFGDSEKPDWIQSVTDMASFYTWFQQELDLEGTRVIGFSMGGWIAAEIAATCNHAFSKMMLVNAAGIKPNNSEIADIFIITPAQIADLMFHDPAQVPEYDQIYKQDLTPDQINQGERNREMAVRVCWKPYMHDPRLPYLLKRVHIPTQIVWGKQDKIVPLECGEIYKDIIPGSDLTVIDNCGHAPQLEKPGEFVKIALDFLK